MIPAEIRKTLGIEIGQDVNLSVENDSLKISTSISALEELQRMARSVKKDNTSVIDEFIAERRREAENE